MNPNITNNNSAEIKVNEIPKKIIGELSKLKQNLEEEKENEIISQSEERLKSKGKLQILIIIMKKKLKQIIM